MKTMKRKLCGLLAVMMMFGSVAAMPVKADDDNDPKPTRITRLSHSSRTVKPGKEFEIKAYTSMRDYEEDYLVWYISNTKVVRFDDDDRTGDDMEFKARKAGTAYITCKIAGTEVKKTCKVTVTNRKGKAKITVDDTRMEVDRGEWEDIEAKLVGGNYKNRKLTYSVSNKRIIRVRRGKVYGRRVGRAKITIRSKANRNIKKTVYVRVERDD